MILKKLERMDSSELDRKIVETVKAHPELKVVIHDLSSMSFETKKILLNDIYFVLDIPLEV